eukprot:TRINITY_DN5017_c0_g1_i2.p3 TRINITY_DN5017_c0_g1~~TRINITY_DN5017_c0_g1_i2.p3  ORF type:complete len:105 (+),score=19.10 TRINITY_DN5017_c0_g1_i2:190-504(+)
MAPRPCSRRSRFFLLVLALTVTVGRCLNFLAKERPVNQRSDAAAACRKLLNLETDATPLELKKAYRRLTLALAPDGPVEDEDALQAQLRKAGDCYQLLKNPTDL